MVIEQNDRSLAEIARDFSKQLIFEGRGESYLVDNSFAVKLRPIDVNGAGHLFIATIDDLVSATHRVTNYKIINVRGERVTLNRGNNLLFIGEKYTLTFQSRTSYSLRSSAPITVEPIQADIDLIALVKERQAEKLA